MAYVLSNLSDDKLEELATSIWEERKDRVLKDIVKYPKPTLARASHVDRIKTYREENHCSLFVAKTIIDFYADKME